MSERPEKKMPRWAFALMLIGTWAIILPSFIIWQMESNRKKMDDFNKPLQRSIEMSGEAAVQKVEGERKPIDRADAVAEAALSAWRKDDFANAARLAREAADCYRAIGKHEREQENRKMAADMEERLKEEEEKGKKE